MFFVVEANHQLFTKSSLVQIGGRVGRSMDRPTGELIFFHDGLNQSIKRAIKEIKTNESGGRSMKCLLCAKSLQTEISFTNLLSILKGGGTSM